MCAVWQSEFCCDQSCVKKGFLSHELHITIRSLSASLEPVSVLWQLKQANPDWFLNSFDNEDCPRYCCRHSLCILYPLLIHTELLCCTFSVSESTISADPPARPCERILKVGTSLNSMIGNIFSLFCTFVASIYLL